MLVLLTHLFEAFFMLDLHKNNYFKTSFLKMFRHDKRIFMVEKYD